MAREVLGVKNTVGPDPGDRPTDGRGDNSGGVREKGGTHVDVYSEFGLGALKELDDEVRGIKIAYVALVHGHEGLVELWRTSGIVCDNKK